MDSDEAMDARREAGVSDNIEQPPEPPPLKMQIIFRSGAQITFDVKTFTTSRSPITGQLVSLEWATRGSATTWLHGIYNLDEVVAIVGIDGPESPPAAEDPA